MAWVEKHGDGFRVRYRLPDGSLYSETGFATRDQAENRAADVESDQRRDQFVDPRLARTTVGDWIHEWTAAHDVSDGTWAKYNSHLHNHILPRFADMPLGDVKRIVVKGWVKTLRRSLAESSVRDVVTLFSMIMGEAVDEELIGANPCRKLRIDVGGPPERPHASADDVDALAGRVSPENAVLITTAAYSGMRWGELAGLQWSRTNLDTGQITIDPEVGALHEIKGRLELGPPKTPASVRTVYLPAFLVDALAELRRRNPTARFVFTGTDGGLLRRSNFRRRVWLPALAGDPKLGWAPIQPGMHFHDLRHTYKTWLIEDGVPDVLQHKQMGHKYHGVPGIYSHVTRPMIDAMLAGLQARWEQFGSTIWTDHYPETTVVKIACSHSAPTDEKRPADEDRQQAV
ncbi:site-specific integrase [Kibdelosporangium persicum]|uniref:Multidrug DMT transporter permease n=1 Tax=Kibdelosporangium persicum TaxID=2698649 RepID=A0ABX2F318_9PSEU|nr:site-specific integrase [Kibdelosporangium persicum]NRN65724.1 Multidrug DMT transporter permease [Kibdelosporangium persicum]